MNSINNSNNSLRYNVLNNYNLNCKNNNINNYLITFDNKSNEFSNCKSNTILSIKNTFSSYSCLNNKTSFNSNSNLTVDNKTISNETYNNDNIIYNTKVSRNKQEILKVKNSNNLLFNSEDNHNNLNIINNSITIHKNKILENKKNIHINKESNNTQYLSKHKYCKYLKNIRLNNSNIKNINIFANCSSIKNRFLSSNSKLIKTKNHASSKSNIALSFYNKFKLKTAIDNNNYNYKIKTNKISTNTINLNNTFVKNNFKERSYNSKTIFSKISEELFEYSKLNNFNIDNNLLNYYNLLSDNNYLLLKCKRPNTIKVDVNKSLFKYRVYNKILDSYESKNNTSEFNKFLTNNKNFILKKEQKLSKLKYINDKEINKTLLDIPIINENSKKLAIKKFVKNRDSESNNKSNLLKESNLKLIKNIKIKRVTNNKNNSIISTNNKSLINNTINHIEDNIDTKNLTLIKDNFFKDFICDILNEIKFLFFKCFPFLKVIIDKIYNENKHTEIFNYLTCNNLLSKAEITAVSLKEVNLLNRRDKIIDLNININDFEFILIKLNIIFKPYSTLKSINCSDKFKELNKAKMLFITNMYNLLSDNLGFISINNLIIIIVYLKSLLANLNIENLLFKRSNNSNINRIYYTRNNIFCDKINNFTYYYCYYDIKKLIEIKKNFNNYLLILRSCNLINIFQKLQYSKHYNIKSYDNNLISKSQLNKNDVNNCNNVKNKKSIPKVKLSLIRREKH